MNRQCWQEVARQLSESRGAGLVAVLLLAIATAWSGLLVEAHRWVGRILLNPFSDASIAATVTSQNALDELLPALRAAFPGLAVAPLPAHQVRQELVEWFPDVASAIEGLPADVFPPLLTLSVPREQEHTVAQWLRGRPQVVLIEHSHRWEARVRESFRTVWVVAAAVGAALLAACAVVVVLAVRLLVQLHREEIVIMRLIGAYEGDIRLPYLLSGLLLGVLGGCIGGGSLVIGWAALRTVAEGIAFPGTTVVLLPCGSGMVGLLGAVLGLSSVSDPDLVP